MDRGTGTFPVVGVDVGGSGWRPCFCTEPKPETPTRRVHNSESDKFLEIPRGKGDTGSSGCKVPGRVVCESGRFGEYWSKSVLLGTGGVGGEDVKG